MEQNQTDYFSLTQIRACNSQALFFLSSAKFATYIMEKKHNYNLLKLWRYYHEKVSGYYCCTRCDYRC